MPFENQMPLFYPIFNLLSKNPLIQEIVSLFLVIIIGFVIQRLNNQYPFFINRTLLPSSLFILIVGGVPELHILHPVYFAAIFFVFAIIRAFRAYESKAIFSNSFDSGLLIGIGSLFYFNLIFFFPVLIIGLRIIKREFNYRNLVLCFFGFLLPWIFTFSFYYFFDKTNQLTEVLKQNFLIHNNQLEENLPLLGYAGFLSLMVLISGILAISRFDEKKISIRKYYSFFLVAIVSLAGILVFSPFASVEVFVLLAVPSAFLISSLLLSIKRRFWAELIFTIFLGAVIFMQFTAYFFGN